MSLPGASEIIVILVLGIILFGPEQLPELARKLARVYKYLLGIANGARDSIASQLGPEYADLKVTDLTPRNLAAKYLGEAMKEIEEVREDLAGVREDVDHLVQQQTLDAMTVQPFAGAAGAGGAGASGSGASDVGAGMNGPGLRSAPGGVAGSSYAGYPEPVAVIPPVRRIYSGQSMDWGKVRNVKARTRAMRAAKRLR